tara:strand:- start:30 stop:245 length:216 start_codon:yes stop_codon:yes gene_type:complete
MIGMSTLSSAEAAKRAAEINRKSDFSGRQKDANRQAVLSSLTGAGTTAAHLPFIAHGKSTIERMRQGQKGK